jgi:hypothetical protein
MANIGSLVADLKLESSAFIRDMGKAQRAISTNTAKMKQSLRAVETQSRNLNRQFSQLKSGAVALAGALAVRQFVQFTQSALDSADAIAKTADSVNISTDALQEYRVAAGLSGIATGDFDKALQKFVRTIGDTRNNTGTLITILKQSDQAFLQQIQSVGSTEQALDLFFRKLESIPDASERASLAAAAFGRQGVRLLNILRDGSAGIEDMRKQARDLGLVLGGDLLRNAEAINDRMSLLKQAFGTGFSRSIIEGFAGSFELTAANINAAREAGENFGRLVGTAMRGVAKAAEFVGRNIREIVTVLGALAALKAAGIFIAMAGAVVTFSRALIGAAKAGALVNMIMGKSVLGVIAKLAVTLGSAAAFWEVFGKEAEAAIKATEKAVLDSSQGIKTGVSTQTTAIQKSTAALKLEAYQSQKLAEALGRSKKEYEELAAAIELENEASRLSVDLTTKAGQEWLTAARAAQKYKKEFDAVKAAEEDRIQKEKELSKEREKAFTRPFENAIDGIQSSFTTMFEGIFSGGVDSFKDLASSVKSIFIRMAAEIATLMVFRPVVGNVLGSVGLGGIASSMGLGGIGGGSGGSAAAAAGVGLGDFTSIGNSLLSGFATPGIGRFIADQALNVGLGTTAAGRGFLFQGGANLGYGALGGLGANLLGLGSGNMLVDTGFGTAGAFIGGGLGGPIGAAAGGFLGTTLGGALFGGKKPSVGPVTEGFISQPGGVLNTGSDMFSVTGVGADNGGPMDAGRQFAEGAATLLNALNAVEGISIGNFPGQFRADIQTGAFQTFLHPGFGDTNNRLGGNLATGTDAEKVLIDSVRALVTRGFAEIDSPEVLSAIRNSAAETVDQFVSDMNFAAALRDLSLEPENLTQAEQALKQINDQFTELTARARALGLETTILDQKRTEAVAGLMQGMDEANRLAILQFTDPMQAALDALAATQEQRLKEVESVGASTVLLERRYALEREKIIEQFAGQATSTLGGLLNQVTYGGLSGASPSATLEGSRAAFELAAAAASPTNAQSLSDLSARTTDFLNASREFNASGAGFQADRSRAESVISGLLNQAAGSGDQSVVVAAITDGNVEIVRVLSQMANILSSVQGITEDQARDISDLVATLERERAAA